MDQSTQICKIESRIIQLQDVFQYSIEITFINLNELFV